MIELNVQQGSAEWHKARLEHFTASEAPAMMGASKYLSRNELLQLKKTGISPDVSAAQQRLFDKGHAAEAAARPIAAKIVGEELFPATAVSEQHSHLLASFDGVTMLEDVIWEHKLYSESLVAQIAADDLDLHYVWQIEQQLLVSGAERCLFMCSDGTEGNCHWLWYHASAGRQADLLDGWEQFKADLEAFEPTETAQPVTAAPVLDLPSVSVQVSGELSIANNFSTFESALRDFVENRLIVKPETDQDFANLESQIKTLKKAESALDAAEAQLLSQVATVDELKRTKDLLHKLARDNRLRAEKLVKTEKENRRLQIISAAKEAFNVWITEQGSPIQAQSSFDPATAMKGKKTISSLQSAADDELARAKIEAKGQIDLFKANKAILDAHSEYQFLFNDWQQLIQKQTEDLQAMIKARIAEHKEAEQKRLDAEREKIRAEEEDKARAAVQSKQIEQEDPGARAEVCQPGQPAQRPQSVIQSVSFDTSADEMISITRTEYEQLRKDSALLHALIAGGVDNWEGYDDAVSLA